MVNGIGRGIRTQLNQANQAGKVMSITHATADHSPAGGTPSEAIARSSHSMLFWGGALLSLANESWGRSNQSPLAAPKRRWFRFGLRTLFVMVTLLCGWLAYQLNWIQSRRALIAETPKWRVIAGRSHSPQPRSPAMLWLFAEPGYAFVQRARLYNQPDLNEISEIKRAQSLFPEARIVAVGELTGTHLDPREEQ